jgi:peptide-methionine (S)-S-oxide reductase
MLRAALVASLLLVSACSGPASPPTSPTRNEPSPAPAPEPRKEAAPVTPTPTATEKATFATGCFWCSEAVFQRVAGVVSVRSGFTGGKTDRPTYEDVCTGETGHAEAIEVTYDPSRVSYEALVDWFWRMHDPTTLNRQGADVGTQYRSAIFWHTEAQRDAAEKSKEEAQASFAGPIVTQITKAGPFFEAEKSHQGYYDRNKTAGYCRVVIAPKLHKLNLEDK